MLFLLLHSLALQMRPALSMARHTYITTLKGFFIIPLPFPFFFFSSSCCCCSCGFVLCCWLFRIIFICSHQQLIYIFIANALCRYASETETQRERDDAKRERMKQRQEGEREQNKTKNNQKPKGKNKEKQNPRSCVCCCSEMIIIGSSS